MGGKAVKFQNGRNVSKNAISCLRVMAKSGFVTRAIWRDYFARGSNRWHRRQLQRLCECRLIEPHVNSKAQGIFVLSIFGKILLAREGLRFALPPFVGQLDHDELVLRSVLELSKQKLIRGFLLENEMKRSEMRQHQITTWTRAEDQRYPDAIFELNVLGKKRMVALEYERTRKSPRRYRDKLWAYSHSNSFWVVIFVCESEAIKSMIKRQLYFLRCPELSGKVAFVDKKQWLAGPADASVNLESQTFSIRTLVTPKCSEKDREVALQVAL
jgi:hypothetical protein